VNGNEVLHKIGKTPVGPGNPRENSRPKTEVKILKAYLSDAEGTATK
jgi:hypothetical protein